MTVNFTELRVLTQKRLQSKLSNSKLSSLGFISDLQNQFKLTSSGPAISLFGGCCG
ncbi:hypothetical protein H5410_033613 [Solanum commersonii]|uniref:Uncharacterized protein n=1 Tax=Solanum commersonii TaxID=4109 RepID=A0A9J5YNC2_SOLCO|nr:hypothetical protein H5410_033613 [Solanum commersonii]